MEENKRGGKRSGAGRKPSGIEKKTISFYIEKGKIYKFGSEDKLKKEVYLFIDGYGRQTNLQDLNKPTNQIQPHEQPQTNYSANNTDSFQIRLPKAPKSFLQYQAEKKELENEEQYAIWLSEVDADLFLSTRQKQLLKSQ